MSEQQTTFQSRLAARLNKLAQKLTDNQIRLSGMASDCIKISVKKTDQGDILSRKIEALDVVSIVFPELVDVPLRKVTNDNGTIIVAPYTFDIQPIEVYVPLNSKIDQDDIIFKFYENLSDEEYFLAIYEVKDILGTFGGRSIIYNKYKLSNYDGTLPNQIITWVTDIARRRELLKW